MSTKDIGRSGTEGFRSESIAEHPLIKHYEPKFLAYGGERFVFTFPGHPDVVAKVSYLRMRKAIEWNLEHGDEAEDGSPELLKTLEDARRMREKKFREFSQFFGSRHVLREHSYVMRVPVTEEMLQQAFQGNPPATPKEVWTIVSIQPFLPALEEAPEIHGIHPYLERTCSDPDVYRRMTDQFVFGKDAGVTDREALRVLFSRDTFELFVKAEDEPGLQRQLKAFTEKAVAFTNATGEMIDLGVKKNVVVLHEKRFWRYLLVDPVFDSSNMSLDVLCTRLLPAVRNGEAMIKNDQRRLAFLLSYVRTINAMAAQLNVPDMIGLVGNPDQFPESDQIFQLIHGACGFFARMTPSVSV